MLWSAFQVWLDASLEANEVPEDPCQLPFPPEAQAVDLGPAINDAIMLALPSANLCGQSDCSIRCKCSVQAPLAQFLSPVALMYTYLLCSMHLIA